jgi:hypothetical protein
VLPGPKVQRPKKASGVDLIKLFFVKDAPDNKLDPSEQYNTRLGCKVVKLNSEAYLSGLSVT